MSAPLDIDQLHTFIAIIDTGSFTKAAVGGIMQHNLAREG